MSKEPIEFLKHIADECSFLLSINPELTKDDFLDDEILKRAIIRSLEIIGEATKKIPADFKVKVEFNPMEKYGRYERPSYSRLFWNKLFNRLGCV